MATNYLNGVAKNNSQGASYAGVGTVKLGNYNNTKLSANSQVVMGVDTKLGGFDGKRNRGFVSDRAPNLPSGYAANGTPTFGQGKANRNTTFNEDRSMGHKDEKFTYFSPQKPTGQKFNR